MAAARPVQAPHHGNKGGYNKVAKQVDWGRSNIVWSVVETEKQLLRHLKSTCRLHKAANKALDHARGMHKAAVTEQIWQEQPKTA